ncbi:hypothetical protein TNCV_3996811 [Trichonephila clavipes]|nr:hypothetical protein TNCV_3996811 [Trichonephila clavipes]
MKRRKTDRQPFELPGSMPMSEFRLKKGLLNVLWNVWGINYREVLLLSKQTINHAFYFLHLEKWGSELFAKRPRLINRHNLVFYFNNVRLYALSKQKVV